MTHEQFAALFLLGLTSLSLQVGHKIAATVSFAFTITAFVLAC